MFKFLTDFIKSSFRPKKHKNYKHKEFSFEEQTTDGDFNLIYYCKNCEEYFQVCCAHGGYEPSHNHGKWKSISNKFKECSGFNKQLEWRKRVYGIPLPIIQKIKAARKISHDLYPTSNFYGKRGHNIRERLRKELLYNIGVNYKPKYDK